VVTPPDPTDVAALAAARTTVLDRIASACVRAGREPAEITLVAVSKTVAAERLRAAVAAGLTVLGENRVQEGEAKRPDVPGARWELVGPLQSNKARKALETFERIQSVDSVGLAERLDRLAAEARPGAPYPILVQVNVDDDPAKAGFAVDDLAAALPAVLALPALHVEGLMTVGRFTADQDEQRATFRALRDLGASLRDRHPGLGPALSMGMTDDFEVAIEEGATIVRVGRALFGERPHAHDGGEAHTH
jgi:pyridoxal phosphate enzyme (YggS family)